MYTWFEGKNDVEDVPLGKRPVYGAWGLGAWDRAWAWGGTYLP